MIFDDAFYPGNKERREKVRWYHTNMRMAFYGYKKAWNEFVVKLDAALSQCKDEKFNKIRLETLKKDIDSDTLKECVDEINTVIGDTKKKMAKLVEDMELTDLLPTDWEKNGVKLSDLDYNAWIAKGVFAGVSATLAGFVAYYVIEGVTLAATLTAVAAAAATSVGMLIGGALGGAIAGGAAFVITDMISSAITGAIEKKKLKEAIDVLVELDTKVTKPLVNSTFKINGIINSIKDGGYFLDDTHLLRRRKDGSYVIIVLDDTLRLEAFRGENDVRRVDTALCDKLIAQGAYKLLIPAPAA